MERAVRRRDFIMSAATVPDTPRNRVSVAANEVSRAWSQWAAAWNAMMQIPDAISAPEPELWEEYKRLVKEVDKKRTAWIRGFVKRG
jgi:hypothetical protein